MMPVDTSYYYYTMPDAGPMQEYMLVPYQEYTHALTKGTYTEHTTLILD